MTGTQPTPGSSPQVSRAQRRATIFVIVLAWLFVLMPFIFWRETWFGRRLNDKQMQEYLTDTQHPRKTQHALSQIADRIIAGDARVRRWYPEVERLAHHALPEVRLTAAWVMGQDNRVPSFHNELLGLLHDSDPLVRQNAALALVRFGERQARGELVAMLRPSTLTAPRAGTVMYRLKETNTVNRGTLVARIEAPNGEAGEVRSPLSGTLEAKLAPEGAQVESGTPIARLAPLPEQVWGALQGLYFCGMREDLPELERYARGVAGMPEKIQQQAAVTANAIRGRGQRLGSRGREQRLRD